MVGIRDVDVKLTVLHFFRIYFVYCMLKLISSVSTAEANYTISINLFIIF